MNRGVRPRHARRLVARRPSCERRGPFDVGFRRLQPPFGATQLLTVEERDDAEAEPEHDAGGEEPPRADYERRCDQPDTDQQVGPNRPQERVQREQPERTRNLYLLPRDELLPRRVLQPIDELVDRAT